MYYVTKTKHVRLDGGRSVVLREGPRGLQLNPITEEMEDLDAKLKKAFPDRMFQSLLRDGTIEERADG